MLITVTVPTSTCATCVATAGIKALFDFTRGQSTARIDSADSAAFATWTTSPPPPHNHAVAGADALAGAWDAWGALNAQLAALPPAPTGIPTPPDPYAALRARWTSTLATLRSRAEALGAPA